MARNSEVASYGHAAALVSLLDMLISLGVIGDEGYVY